MSERLYQERNGISEFSDSMLPSCLKVLNLVPSLRCVLFDRTLTAVQAHNRLARLGVVKLPSSLQILDLVSEKLAVQFLHFSQFPLQSHNLLSSISVSMSSGTCHVCVGEQEGDGDRDAYMLTRSARAAPPPSLCHVCSVACCRMQEFPPCSVVEDNCPGALAAGVTTPARALSPGASASPTVAGVKLVQDMVGHAPHVSLSRNVLHVTSWCGCGRFFVTPTAREACEVCMVCLVLKAQR